jgi:hypothetical protein
MSDPKFPDVEVQLSGEDGNALMAEATAVDYDALLRVTMRWVVVS